LLKIIQGLSKIVFVVAVVFAKKKILVAVFMTEIEEKLVFYKMFILSI
jgi:cytochrome c oxidase subunit IV